MDIPKVTTFQKDGKLFLRAFLIDATLNDNKWKVVSASIPRNIKSAIGMPLVLDQNHDHPKWIEGGLIANITNQERYAIGRIFDVVEKDGKWDALIEVTDPLAREAIENNDIPFYVSPRIIHDPDEQDDMLREWMVAHLAVVNKPAYGDKAKIKGACYGSAPECLIALKQASKEDCGFCVKTELLKLVTNLKDSSLTSLNFEGNKALLVMDAQATQVIDTSKFISREEYDNKVKALESQVAGFKTVAEEAHKAADAKIAAIEEEKRVSKIEGHVKAKIADASKAQETIKKFVDAKVSPEIVADAMALIPDTKGKNNSELFTGKPADASLSHVGSYDKASSYVNTIIRGAQL